MSKKILILNWRDPQSPLEGGAERFTQKYAQFWAQQGNQVWWLTNSFNGSQPKEVIEGVTYLRVGPVLDGSLLKYLFFYPFFLIKAVSKAQKLIKKEGVDIVIDEIHGFPFFTPLFSKVRNVLLVCEVAGPIWDKMFPFPINWLGKILEKLIYQIYSKTEMWAISENTKQNILKLQPQAKVKVIELGIDANPEILSKVKQLKKNDDPTAVFVARLVRMKGIETALEITALIAQSWPDFKLMVIGSGDPQYVAFLKNKAQELGITNQVKFVGRVSELEKFKYLKQADFLLHPSYREGFGLTVLEAGLVGTPAIIRAGSSLDALVEDGRNGFKFTQPTQVKKLFETVYKDRKSKLFSQAAGLKVNHYLWEGVLKRSKKVTGI